ncbi:alpha/beta fold hydrolase [Croceimicrobium hydrocarbonivorans]|uniref:Alpha/beta hydrolase n=1 Tax=Croceimicrobium hydrocarbonivorans TaxID=2761580 RepID=A0A7H0VEY3_9FLAO|nr:alpha/beta hydrolase [Croceimicrobium hydrocarbonivorans]QNR24281.1 alpha/beta hydrolase [Croceimicrobium hydrocarbonivorans]
MRTAIKYFALFALLLIISCKKSGYYEGEHFFISNAGAEMPVFVKGNIESGTFILFLHGGPGGNASLPSFMPVSKELEKDFAFAYWDQRGSGLSMGNPEASTFTVEQFVDDLDLVVETIRLRYHNPRIVFYGISWGGALGSAYLSTKNYQEKVDGFICMDSGHNLVEGLPKSVEFVEAYAQKQIDQNVDKAYWTEARDWCASKPNMTVKENYFKYDAYLSNTNAYRKDPNQKVQGPEVGLRGSLNSYLSLAVFFNGQYLVPRFNILELNLSPDMAKIKIPSLVIWGRHDGVNTIEMGFDAFHSIGGPDFTDKYMVILENSAHEGYIEEQDLFIESFRRFVNSLKN